MLALLLFMIYALGSSLGEHLRGIPQGWEPKQILYVLFGLGTMVYFVLTPYDRFSAEDFRKARLFSSKGEIYPWSGVKSVGPTADGQDARIEFEGEALVDLKIRFVRSGNPVWDHLRRAVPEHKIDPALIKTEKRRKMFWE